MRRRDAWPFTGRNRTTDSQSIATGFREVAGTAGEKLPEIGSAYIRLGDRACLALSVRLPLLLLPPFWPGYLFGRGLRRKKELAGKGTASTP